MQRGESEMDLENWMRDLPVWLRQTVPLIYLAIPGSHNSMTYGIKRASEIAPDADNSVRHLHRLFPLIVKRWSKNQNLDISKQLSIGIRYLDLRIAYNKKQNDYYYAHGLFAIPMKPPLIEVNDFLNNHPNEFVILDFQHFYDINPNKHFDIQNQIYSIFGRKIITMDDGRLEDFTLDYCQKSSKQVLVIYRRSIEERSRIVWPGQTWPTPSLRKNSVKILQKVAKITTKPYPTDHATYCKSLTTCCVL